MDFMSILLKVLAVSADIGGIYMLIEKLLEKRSANRKK